METYQMTDNEPLFEKDANIWRSLELGSQALSLLDECKEQALKRLSTLHRDDLEYTHISEYYRAIDRWRNYTAYELAQLAESYGHPDWEVDA
jgi:hypothetical protein